MRKIFSALCFTLISAAAVMTSCSDVPAPYEIGGDNQNGGGDTAPVGTGTKDSPYDVTTAKANKNDTAWVQGYIVGVMENEYDESGNFSGNKASFEAPFTVKTNIILAGSADETNINKCMPVKIKGGSDLSNAINLNEHPENLGKLLIIKGVIGSGFGVTSLNETSAAVLDGKEIGNASSGDDNTPEDPTPAGKIIFEETFAESQGKFEIKNKELGGLSYVWTHDAKYGMKANAFANNTAVASESQLISPEIDLAKATTATLRFEHAINYLSGEKPETNQIVQISKDGGNNWTTLSGVKYPAVNGWAFVSSGNVDLKSYVGSKVRIAFLYKSTTASAGLWEIKNVQVYSDAEGGSTEEPENKNKIFTEKMSNNGNGANKDKIAEFKGWDNPNLTFADETGTADVRALVHKTENNPDETAKVNHIWMPANKNSKLTITGIKASGTGKFKLTYEVAANTNKEEIDLSVIKVTFNDKPITIPSKKISSTNIFYTLEADFEATGTDNDKLEFSAADTDNTVGLRLYNIQLSKVN